MQEDQSIALESKTLLSEILSVLKRIDGHLEIQDRRIAELGDQLQTFKNSPLRAHSSSRDGSAFQSRHEDEQQPSFRDNTLISSMSSHVSEEHADGRDTDIKDLRSVAVGRVSWPDKFSQPEPSIRTVMKSIRSRESRSTSAASESCILKRDSLDDIGPMTRSGTWNSSIPPPTAENASQDDDLAFYTKFRPPRNWIVTKTHGRMLEVKYCTAESERLWKSSVGDSYTIPPDGRIEMTFQRHLLERLNKGQVTSLLATLKDVSSRLEYQNTGDINKRGSFRVTDYEFDPDYRDSVAEYRAEIPVGRIRPVQHRLSHSEKVTGALKLEPLQGETGPWKRVIEIRGLSKELLPGHEVWRSDFRDPWHEALPDVNTVCPFFTDRENPSHPQWLRTINDALIHHQQCRRYSLLSNNNMCFHVTFYELIDLTHEDDFEGDIWRLGKLHSDAETEASSQPSSRLRRIRESSCTLVMLPDPLCSQYWTLLTLYPNNFDIYDKTHKYEQYDTISTAIRGQDAQAALEAMISLSVHVLIARWEDLATYFSQGHHNRDILADPSAHDRLLFDDDSFSRSRRYFWVINYLAELEISITANIDQIERFTKNSAVLQGQCNRLHDLRARLRSQRNEAIALRDGLFSASSVMESRASTRLGENIKLLTFVSIFFLPLSFCMSMWSISTDLFSLRALAITVLSVGLGTYFLVFNLNTFVYLASRSYNRWKYRIIETMKNDADRRWAREGRRFVTFAPTMQSRSRDGDDDEEERNGRPSEWRIVHYLCYKLFQKMRKRKDGADAKDEGQEQKQSQKTALGGRKKSKNNMVNSHLQEPRLSTVDLSNFRFLSTDD